MGFTKCSNNAKWRDGKDRKILYSSGAIHTKDKFSVHEGKIEMRATMPEGIGTWPAFWTWPEDYSQASNIPAKEEIDVFEIYGDNLQRVTGTAHALKADNTYASFIGSISSLAIDFFARAYSARNPTSEPGHSFTKSGVFSVAIRLRSAGI